MNVIERSRSVVSQVKKELTGLTLSAVPAIGLLTARSILHVKLHNTITDGYPLPRSGPFIATGNHFETSDTYKGHYVGFVLAGRLIRVFIKRSLVTKGAVESDEYLASLGETKEMAIKEYDPLKSFVIRGMGAIDLLRDGVGVEALRKGSLELTCDHGLAILLEPHRYSDCSLRNLQPGAAYIARKFPDVPVYPVAISGPPHGPDKITVIEPFTYNQIAKELGRNLSDGEFTVLMADRTATGLPESSQLDWQTRRETELVRLTSSRPVTRIR